MGYELLTLQDISKYYTSGQSVVMGLNRINLTFCAGEFVAITGESGSGKSTLAKVMAGIHPYESGEMLLKNRPTSHFDSSDWERYRSSSISFISQSYDILPGCTVLRNTVSALRLTGMEKEAAAVRAEEILRQVELWHLRNRRAAKLSSGQKQRLSIARALAKPAPILIADEPTGNLDSENSAKIIELLSAAARDRLVIMITHEFEEVADTATRRIIIQDGIVAADIPLRSPKPAAENDSSPVPGRKHHKGLSLYTALLQMTARPVWTTIMLTFFTLTAFAVFAFLGTFIVNIDDTPTRLYDNSAFRNGSMTRIVAVHPDGEALSDDDLQALLALPHVNYAERFGYVTDLNYFYREGIDYFSHYSAIGGSMLTDNTEISAQVTLEGYSLFLETVPARMSGEFLTAGRLPETAYEVVAGDEKLLGQTIPVYIQDTKNWNRTAYIIFQAEVVGTTDMGPHLYFSDVMGRAITGFLRHAGGSLILPDYTGTLDGGFLCSQPMYQQMTYWLAESEDDTIEFMCPANNYEILPLKYLGTHDICTLLHSIVVSPETFDLMVEADYGPQISLTIENYAYTDEVLNAVRALGYGALSPYQMGSNQQNPTLAAERMQTLKVCLMALAAVILLQVIVLRAMFSMEMEEYRLLAALGLRCKNAKRSIFWQIIIFSLGGEAFAVLAVALCSILDAERIVSILRYLPAPYLLVTWVIHFAASLLTTLWIADALRRQVYPVTGGGIDLEMDEEVEA